MNFKNFWILEFVKRDQMIKLNVYSNLLFQLKLLNNINNITEPAVLPYVTAN